MCEFARACEGGGGGNGKTDPDKDRRVLLS